MQKLFNKILVPVDFSRRSIKAAERAVDLANEYDCSITLLHTVTLSPFTAFALAEGHFAGPNITTGNQGELRFRMNKIIDEMMPLMKRPDISGVITRGGWHDNIIQHIREKGTDLVLVGQRSKFTRKRKMLLNPDKIAEQTDIPVITIPVNKRLNRILSIVIPVTDFLPLRKLMYGIYIAGMKNATIRLLSVQTSKNSEVCDQYLKKAYRMISDNSSVTTEMEHIECGNTAEAVNQYISKRPADLLILNPGTQTKMRGPLSSFLGRIIQKYTTAPVLTISPL